MKCLVTGGCGFIGSHVVDLLIANGHEVTVVDDLSTGVVDNLNKEAKHLLGSITSPTFCRMAVSGKQWIFHLAAWARVQRSIDDTWGTHNVNVNGTLNMLEAVRLSSSVDRFIYSSSSSIYGDQKTPEMVETLFPHPKSPYALQKLIGEQYVNMYAKTFKIKAVSLRYFNVYGERQLTTGAYALVIGKFFEQLKNNEPMTVYGDGSQTRAYTHVSDVAQANLLATQIPLEKGDHKYFNIGTNVETSVKRISELIGGKVQYIDPNPRGDFEEMRKCANYEKARTQLGWAPTVSIEQGIEILKKTYNINTLTM